MKKATKFIIAAVVLISFSGCLTTLHPIFTEKELTFDARLKGSWKDQRTGSSILFRNPAQTELQMLSPALQGLAKKIFVMESRNAEGILESIQFSFLVKLGKYFYFDCYPVQPPHGAPVEDFFSAHYVPMHSIYRATIKSSEGLVMERLDGGYVESLIRNKKIRLDHEESDDGTLIITASTRQLQDYLVKYSDVPAAYDKDGKSEYSKTN